MVYRNLTMQLEKLTVTGTEQPDGISPGNLDATVDALTLLVNLSTSQGQVLTMENAHSLVETASTLLSENNMDSWDSVLEVSFVQFCRKQHCPIFDQWDFHKNVV